MLTAVADHPPIFDPLPTLHLEVNGATSPTGSFLAALNATGRYETTIVRASTGSLRIKVRADFPSALTPLVHGQLDLDVPAGP